MDPVRNRHARAAVFTRKGCGGCEDHKAVTAKDYKRGELVELPLEDPENAMLADRWGVRYTPQCGILGPDGRIKRLCTPNEERKLLWREE